MIIENSFRPGTKSLNYASGFGESRGMTARVLGFVSGSSRKISNPRWALSSTKALRTNTSILSVRRGLSITGIATGLGSGNLNVGDNIRVAAFRVAGVHCGSGITVGSAVCDRRIRIEGTSVQQGVDFG